MIRFNNIYIVSMISLWVIFSCGGNSDNSSNPPGTEVTLIDHGASVLDPISTTVTINPESIEYETEQSDTIIEEWSESIESADYESAQKIVDDYKLLQMNDVTLAGGQGPCTGWQGMTIMISNTTGSHSFDIPGAVCSPEQWPEGVHELVDLRDKLVDKYQ